MSFFGFSDEPRFDMSDVKRFALGAALVVLFSATAVATGILLEVDDDIKAFKSQSKPIPQVEDLLADVPTGEPQTILLLGSDRRFADIGNAPARSDTILIVRLDADENAMAVMSIPRDLQVHVPGHGTRKINEAYHLGGPKLVVQTVDELLAIDVNHVVNVNFGGFRRAVNRLGCFYVDVDRRYFNDNSGPGPDYATIDLEPGYQKLCGQDALDFVRFRHDDSDFVRAARQQSFLTQAKEQVSLGRLFSDRKELLRIFGRYTQTDIAKSDTAEILGLLKLAYASSKSPVTEIEFPAKDCNDGTCVEIGPEELARTVIRFIDARGDPTADPSTSEEPKRIRRSTKLAPGLANARAQGESHAPAMSVRLDALGLPVYYPKVILVSNGAGYAKSVPPRSYEIYDREHKRHRAYRLVLYAGRLGQYYGVQGTTWKDPPILDTPTDERIIGGRRFRRYFDGKKVKLVAWETPQAVYWVSNTLSLTLTNRQMMEIARSLQRI